MMSRFGLLMPFFRTGTAFRNDAFFFASHERKIHQKDTSMNCMIVNVTGLGRAVKMAFDDVFVRIEVAYQKPQSILQNYQHRMVL